MQVFFFGILNNQVPTLTTSEAFCSHVSRILPKETSITKNNNWLDLIAIKFLYGGQGGHYNLLHFQHVAL